MICFLLKVLFKRKCKSELKIFLLNSNWQNVFVNCMIKLIIQFMEEKNIHRFHFIKLDLLLFLFLFKDFKCRCVSEKTVGSLSCEGF